MHVIACSKSGIVYAVAKYPPCPPTAVIRCSPVSSPGFPTRHPVLLSLLSRIVMKLILFLKSRLQLPQVFMLDEEEL